MRRTVKYTDDSGSVYDHKSLIKDLSSEVPNLKRLIAQTEGGDFKRKVKCEQEEKENSDEEARDSNKSAR